MITLKPKIEQTRITVKGVKILASLSEETLCFTASVYFDGKKVGTAQNRGHGGPTDIDVGRNRSSDKRAEVEKYADSIDVGEFNDMDHLEQIIDELVYLEDEKKQYKSMTRNKVAFHLKGEDKGSFHIMGWRRGVKMMPEMEAKAIADIKAKYGDKLDYIVNEILK